MRPFQIILFALFAAFGVGGLIMFATFRGFSGQSDALTPGVRIWGTLDNTSFQAVLEGIKTSDDRWKSVKYTAMDPRTFSEELVNSLAEGDSPDLVIVPSDLLSTLYAKLTPIPYANYPERTYRDTFVDGADIFMFPNGIYALPFAVDPLVMYWNRGMIASAGLSTPPKTWTELTGETLPKVTKYADNGDITQSTVAFGEFSNVRHAKEILMMLIMQAGGRVSVVGERGPSVDLKATVYATPLPPANAALNFYSNFSDPSPQNTFYTWNRAFSGDRETFLAGDLALYFGFASELKDIQNGNPNISFDVAEVPQSEASKEKRGFGTFYGLAIPKTAHNPAGAYEVATTLSRDTSAFDLVKRLGFAPAHRSLIGSAGANPLADVFFRSALVARGWLDPNPKASNTILGEMIESLLSGRADVSDAVADATIKLQNAF